MSIVIQGFPVPVNTRMYKLAAAAKVAGVSYTISGFGYNVENCTAEYINNCHPLGRTPSIQTDEGYIFESNSCLRYIARQDRTNSFLYGRTAFEASQVDMWLDYVTNEVERGVAPFIGKVLGEPMTAEQEKANVEIANCGLTGIENWLEIRTFLVGERMTIADINLAFILDSLYRYGPDGEAVAKKFKNVFRLYTTVMYQPKIVEVLTSSGIGVGLPKSEKKKEEPKKKEEKKPAKKEEAADEDDVEDEIKEEKKKPNPLDSLPPSTFVLDAFKREYSNKDTRKEAAPYLFEKFDDKGFCAFWCKYKYNDELTKPFMTGNLVRGWFQRMDHVRKYAFGSIVIAGEESKHEILGLWIFRGQGLPEIVTDVDDTDLYTWTPIPDIRKEADKITDYLAWDGATFATQPVLEGRTYK